MHVKVGDKDWSLLGNGRTNDTPTQVHEVGQETAMQPFEELNVAGPFNIIYEQGVTNSVRVEGTIEQLEKITIYVKDNELIIDQRKDEDGNIFKGMRIFVTSTAIDGIEIAGSGTVTVPKVLNTNDLNLEVAGSGEVTLTQLNCKSLHNEIAGSGKVTTGAIQAEKVMNEIAGSGDIDIAGLICNNLSNEIAGSGDIVINNMNVDVVESNIAGSGDITLVGKVGRHTEDIVGSGSVNTSGLQTTPVQEPDTKN